MYTMNIFTYNILSDSYCSPGFYTTCDPEHLKPEKRMNTLKDILREQIRLESIICLQEITRVQEAILQSFFNEQGYTLITCLYGKAWSGFMGVGIAVPKKFRVVDTKFVRVADGKKWAKKEKPGRLSKLVTFFLTELGVMAEPERDPLEDAQNRQNVMVLLELGFASCGPTFYIGTYHMPCAFRTPIVMTIHSALVAQAIQKEAGDKPYILAGDFNLKPSSDQYGLLTTGKMSATSNEHPLLPEGDDWTSDVKPMKSAYKEVSRLEPYFTNYAQSRGQPVFIECLDYIFYEGLKPMVVLDIPTRSAINGPLPNEAQPSDHVPIGATFEV